LFLLLTTATDLFLLLTTATDSTVVVGSAVELMHSRSLALSAVARSPCMHMYVCPFVFGSAFQLTVCLCSYLIARCIRRQSLRELLLECAHGSYHDRHAQRALPQHSESLQPRHSLTSSHCVHARACTAAALSALRTCRRSTAVWAGAVGVTCLDLFVQHSHRSCEKSTCCPAPQQRWGAGEDLVLGEG
jgi:hypothetical protein